jgi:hypothetical protein
MKRIVALALVAACSDPLADGNLMLDPIVTAITPERAFSRGGQEITVIGKNFREGVVVKLDGETVPALIRNSSEQLTFFAPPSAPGSKKIAVENSSQSPARAVADFAYYADTLRWVEKQWPYVGDGFEPVVGETDGKPGPDVVLWFGDWVSLVNRDHGRVLEPVATIANDEPAGLPVGLTFLLADVTGDGLDDFLSFTALHPAIGGGRFGDPVPVVAKSIIKAAAGDFLGTGRKQLLIAEYETAVPRLLSFDADGKLIAQEELPALSFFPADGYVSDWQPDVTDLNQDGKDDLVFVNANREMAVALGPTLDVVWTSAPVFSGSGDVGYVGAVEVTKDGFPDLLFSGSSFLDHFTTELQFSSQGPLSWAEPIKLPNLCGGSTIQALYQQPNLDDPGFWATCFSAHGRFLTWKNGLPIVETVANTLGHSATLSDMDGDGALDVVWAWDGARIFFSGEPGNFHSRWGANLPDNAMGFGGVRTAILDRGTASARMVAANGNSVSVLTPNGQAVASTYLHPVPEDEYFDGVLDLDVCDFDQDGKEEVAAAFHTGEGFTFLLFEASPDAVTLTAAIPWPNSVDPGWLHDSLRTGDIDGDGDCDLLWQRRPVWTDETIQSAPAVLFKNDGAGALAPEEFSVESPLIDGYTDPEELFDLDEDGDLDLYRATTQGLLAWRNHGDGTFADKEVLILGSFDEALARLRDDGVPEIWTLSTEREVTRFSLAGGEPVREDARTLAAEATPTGARFHFGDFDGDGLADALLFVDENRLQNSPDHTGHSLLRSDGTRIADLTVLPPPDPWTEPRSGYEWFSAFEFWDFDGDGLFDVSYASNITDEKVVWVRNASF